MFLVVMVITLNASPGFQHDIQFELQFGSALAYICIGMVAPAELKYVIPAVFEDSHALTECCRGMGWCVVFFYT